MNTIKTALVCLCVIGSPLLADTMVLNYSLWPRRPEAIAKARTLILQQELDEALKVLAPYVREKNIGGKEARSLIARINIRRYLSRQNPHAVIYTVRSGDHITRVAQTSKTPLELLYTLNGIIDPSRLNINQKLVAAPMQLVIELDVVNQELRVWDAETLVVVYPMQFEGKTNQQAAATTELKVSDRLAYLHGNRISLQSPSYMSADRVLKLSDGACIAGEQSLSGATGTYRLAQRDMNELALLISTGTVVQMAD